MSECGAGSAEPALGGGSRALPWRFGVGQEVAAGACAAGL